MNRQAGFGFWHAMCAAALLCSPAYGKAQAAQPQSDTSIEEIVVTAQCRRENLQDLLGVGITAIGPGIENSVALYVDGVYRGSSSSDAMTLNNIAGVEVEKGPQGTLFGRNCNRRFDPGIHQEPEGGASERLCRSRLCKLPDDVRYRPGPYNGAQQPGQP
jgi:outer membrane cobalamin receptor